MLGGRNTFLIKVASTKRDTIDVGGAKLVIDTDYNKYKHAVQVGVIQALPFEVSRSEYHYNTPLSVGDKVLFHHMVCQPDRKVNVQEGLYRCEYFNIYAKVDGEDIIPLEEVIFVDSIMESVEDLSVGVLIKPHREVVRQQGIVVHASRCAQSQGVLPGDRIFFTQSADYTMPVEGRNLYRMRMRNVLAVERDGKLVCLSDKLLVRQLPDNNDGKVVFDTKVEKRLYGEIVAVGSNLHGVSAGDHICYFQGVGGSVKYRGETYCFIDIRHINYLIIDNMAKPALDRIMLKQDAGEDKIGVLEVPDTAKEKPRRGTVVSVGPGSRHPQTGEAIPVCVKAGDRVIYSEYSGVKVSVDGEEYVMVKENDLILIL